MKFRLLPAADVCVGHKVLHLSMFKCFLCSIELQQHWRLLLCY